MKAWQILRAILRTSKGVVGLVLIMALFVIAIGAERVSPLDPYRQDLRARFQAPGVTIEKPVPRTFILGTDHVGRDILSRMIYGARISIIVGISAVLISGSIGTLLGLLSGYYGGWLDGLVMRAVDMQLSMPMILFAIAWIAFVGPGLVSVVVVVGVWGWVQYARFTRSMVLSLKEAEFVLASRALGARPRRIIFRHIAPNLMGPVIIIATLQLGQAVLLESALSFLGVGIQAPTPTWGGMVADGRNYVDTAWWSVVFPGAAITLFVLGANFLGDALRDVLDPRTARAGRA